MRLQLLYIEQTPPAARWEAPCAAVAEAGQRLAVLRSGTSEAGRLAIASHTGSLVGADRGFELLCDRYGVLAVSDVSGLVEVA